MCVHEKSGKVAVDLKASGQLGLALRFVAVVINGSTVKAPYFTTLSSAVLRLVEWQARDLDVWWSILNRQRSCQSGTCPPRAETPVYPGEFDKWRTSTV